MTDRCEADREDWRKMRETDRRVARWVNTRIARIVLPAFSIIVITGAVYLVALRFISLYHYIANR